MSETHKLVMILNNFIPSGKENNKKDMEKSYLYFDLIYKDLFILMWLNLNTLHILYSFVGLVFRGHTPLCFCRTGSSCGYSDKVTTSKTVCE